MGAASRGRCRSSLSYSLSLPHYCMCCLHLSVSISCPFSSHHLDFLSFPLIYSPLGRFSSLLQPKFQGPKEPSNFASAVGSIFKANRHLYLTQEPLWLSQGYRFSSGHVCMWELDCEESWAPKNWCFWTVVLEKTLESPLDCEEIPLVHPKGDQSWVFIGRTDAEAELQYFGHLMWRVDSLEKILMLGGIGGRRRRGQQRMRWLDGITD